MEVNGFDKISNNLEINTKSTNEFTNDNVKKNEEYKNSSKDETIEKKIDEVNNLLKDQNVHAEYSVHNFFKNRILIKIIDDETNKIIMEVPPEKLLDAAASMCKAAGVLVDKKA